MTITVRMDAETERLLRRLVREKRRSTSEIVREAVQTLAQKEGGHRKAKGPYNAILPFIGIADSGGQNLSEDAHTKFRQALLRKKQNAKNTR